MSATSRSFVLALLLATTAQGLDARTSALRDRARLQDQTSLNMRRMDSVLQGKKNSGFKVGDKVEVHFGGEWHKGGVVSKVANGKYWVKGTDVGLSAENAVGPKTSDQVRAQAQTGGGLKVGDAVEVLIGGEWHKDGVVSQVTSTGEYMVRGTDMGFTNTNAVGPKTSDEVRAPGSGGSGGSSGNLPGYVAVATVSAAARGKTRPLEWGVSGHPHEPHGYGMFCTIGGYMCGASSSNVYAITNAHCLTGAGQHNAHASAAACSSGRKKKLVQPSRGGDGGSMSDAISDDTVDAWVGYADGDRHEDWAAFRLKSSVKVSMRIAAGGHRVADGAAGTAADFGIGTPSTNTVVFKAGRTTGFTTASTKRVQSDAGCVEAYPSSTKTSLIFCDKLADTAFMNGGDSGSFLFTKTVTGEYKAIGQLAENGLVWPMDKLERKISAAVGETVRVCTTTSLGARAA